MRLSLSSRGRSHGVIHHMAAECVERFADASERTVRPAVGGRSQEQVPEIPGTLTKCLVVAKRTVPCLGGAHASIVGKFSLRENSQLCADATTHFFPTDVTASNRRLSPCGSRAFRRS